MSTRIVPVSKYAGEWDDDDYNVPGEIMAEVKQEYEAFGDDWKKKKEFLDKVYDENYGTELADWAYGMEDELLEEIKDQSVEKLEPMVREKAREMGGEENEEVYYEEIQNRIWLPDVADEASFRLWKGENEETVLREELDKMIDLYGRDILLGAQEAIKEGIEADVLTETVRFMQTPEEVERIEIPTEPKKLENIPTEQGLGSITSKKNNRVKRGGKMLTELFKLAHALDKKGEYELANEVDEIIKELSQRAGLTTEEMVSLANDLDIKGETNLADKLDAVLAKKKKTKYKTWKGKDEKPPKGAETKAPKGWFDKMKKEVKAKNPDYSTKRVSEIVGDIWDNELTEEKRQQIKKRYGKDKKKK